LIISFTVLISLSVLKILKDLEEETPLLKKSKRAFFYSNQKN